MPATDDLVAASLRAMGIDPGEQPAPRAAEEAAIADPLSEAEAAAAEASVRGDVKTGHAFAKLRASEREARVKFAELKAKYDEALKSGTITGAEKAEFAKAVEERDAVIKQLEEQVGRVNLEASPAFREKYDGKIARIGSRLTDSLVQFAKVEQDKAASVARALLSASPEQLDAQLAGLQPSVAGIVMGAWQEARELMTAKGAALAEWRKVALAEEHERARMQTEGDIRKRKEVAQAAVDGAAEAGCFVYRDLGTPETREAAGKFRDAFAGFVQTADHAALVRKAADGFAAPVLYNIIDRQKARIQELEAAIGNRNEVSTLPISGGGGGDMRPPAAPRVDSRPASAQRDAIALDAARLLKAAFPQGR